MSKSTINSIKLEVLPFQLVYTGNPMTKYMDKSFYPYVDTENNCRSPYSLSLTTFDARQVLYSFT